MRKTTESVVYNPAYTSRTISHVCDRFGDGGGDGGDGGDDAEYDTFKMPELKGMCRARGLPVSGAKAVLVARLQDADKSGHGGGDEGSDDEEEGQEEEDEDDEEDDEDEDEEGDDE